MKHSMLIISCLALVFVVSCAYQASAQISAVGLYYPDLRAMRTLIGPNGLPNLPPGPDHTKLAKVWNQISREGRNLLLKERDLALIIVDSKGNWLYRTTGVHALRSLHRENEPKPPKDFTSLLPILRHVWFQQLRNFYDRLLFAPNTSSAPAAFGDLLTNVKEATGVTNAEKDWFRSIVGAELRGMDNIARRSLLLDKKYGKGFVDAIALAEVTRNAQLESVGNAIVQGPKHTIGIEDAACHFATDDEFKWTEYNVRFIKGKKLIEVSSMGSVCWLGAKDDDADLPIGFSAKDVRSLLEDGKAMIFVSGNGTTTVYGVKPKKN